MKVKLLVCFGVLLTAVQFPALADTCAQGIKGSGKGGLPFITGSGTKNDPFQLELGKDLCDITLVKSDNSDDSAHNKSYPDDTIYFEYSFQNVPLIYKNAYLNQFQLALVMPNKSAITPSIITGTTYPFDKKAPCKIFHNPPRDNRFNAYNADCGYLDKNFGDKPLRISDTLKFSIGLQDDQEIRRTVDANGYTVQGAASLHIQWLTPPQDEKSNYSK
ncbi:hypothetical protein JQC92_09085 [Shewanella sp. 202IG2-18]|uniref:hypothetical protein n=1 Tax=Parashewanella hymeniacidonis TaxID=2807618 RepID=UPI00195F5031|nr:hypothetical protein [Parashewanella hymeniacidonis]MBM7072179.1 hypothetical protein [Parashewanella hymeniacidonis]